MYCSSYIGNLDYDDETFFVYYYNYCSVGYDDSSLVHHEHNHRVDGDSIAHSYSNHQTCYQTNLVVDDDHHDGCYDNILRDDCCSVRGGRYDDGGCCCNIDHHSYAYHYG